MTSIIESRRRIVLTGGIATGKSTVSGMFAMLGAIIVDADKAARDVVLPGTPCWRELKSLLGPDYFEPDGQLNRRKVRQCIVTNQDLRSKVDAVLHPAIIRTMERQWQELQETDPPRTVLFDIPLLFESGLSDRFDTVILVYVPPPLQIRRLMDRDGLTRSEAEKTLQMQMSIEGKKPLADIVLDNSGSLQDTLRQVDAIWETIRFTPRPAIDALPRAKEESERE